jgi:hypothetical protein
MKWRSRVSRVINDVDIVTVCAVCALFGGGAGAQCIDYADYMFWGGRLDTTGNSTDVAISGSYAYLADG